MSNATEAQTLALSAFLPYRLAVLSNTISTSIADMYDREFGLTIWQWRIMAVVGEHPGLSATEAGARATMDKVAVSRAGSGLIERGDLKRVPAKDDGRRFELSLTEQGKTIYRQVIPIALAYERELLAGFDPADLETLKALMTKLARLAAPESSLW